MSSVATPSFGDALSQKYYVTVILRLVLSGSRDDGGTLEYGEVVDGEGMLYSRFVGWAGLLPAVQDFLASRRDGEE